MSGDSDPRFTKGLVIDVAKALEQHGYERPSGRRWADLQAALFSYLHGPSERP